MNIIKKRIIARIEKSEHEEYYHIINRLSSMKTLKEIEKEKIGNFQINMDEVKHEEMILMKKLRLWWKTMEEKY